MKKQSIISSLAREAKMRMTKYAHDKGAYKVKTMSKEDSELYAKVCKMLSKNNVITNPINELIDVQYYNRLSPDAKQRYILYLSEKYLSMKAKYYQENSINAS